MNIEMFISGAITMCFCVIALFFARFWHRTRDRLFGIFSIAFLLFAFERVILLLIESADEVRTYVYIVRLVAYVLLIFAVIGKNREA